jgi:hypothetical protein
MAKIDDQRLKFRKQFGGEPAPPEGGRGNRKGPGSAPFEENGRAFLTVAALAIRWCISERHVHRFIASGELAVTRFGKSARVFAAEVARFETDRTRVK